MINQMLHFTYNFILVYVAHVLRFFVYSIVGQVAVTGKHRWICADNQVTSSGLSFEVRILVIKYCHLSTLENLKVYKSLSN
jgi:hypothetical protein